MARIEIQIPERFIFSTEVPIRISDINRGRHLAHDAVLSILEEARVRFMTSLGYKDENINGVGLITVDAGVIYKKQGFYGQTLRIELALADFTRKGCDIIYRMTNAETGEEMVRAKNGMLFYDYRQQKVTEVPAEFRQKIAVIPS